MQKTEVEKVKRSYGNYTSCQWNENGNCKWYDEKCDEVPHNEWQECKRHYGWLNKR